LACETRWRKTARLSGRTSGAVGQERGRLWPGQGLLSGKQSYAAWKQSRSVGKSGRKGIGWAVVWSVERPGARTARKSFGTSNGLDRAARKVGTAASRPIAAPCVPTPRPPGALAPGEQGARRGGVPGGRLGGRAIVEFVAGNCGVCD